MISNLGEIDSKKEYILYISEKKEKITRLIKLDLISYNM